MSRSTPAQLSLALTRGELRPFAALFQRGIAVPLGASGPALRFLTEELGIDPAYVAERITTVFLDGQVVDALDTALVRPGSRMALSASLPGLVGATLRRSGMYAAMRASITAGAEPERPAAAADAGQPVQVKLFNMLIDELGPVLLRHGVVLSPEEALAVLPPAVVAGLAQGSSAFVRAEVREETS
jgi:hypothetical protein